MGVWVRASATPIRQPRDRPEKGTRRSDSIATCRSLVSDRTRGTDCLRRGFPNPLARWDGSPKGRDSAIPCSGSPRLGARQPGPAPPDAPNIHWLTVCWRSPSCVSFAFRNADAVFALGAPLVKIRLVDVIRLQS